MTSPARRWAVVIAGCALLAGAIGRRMRQDIAFQDFIATPVGIALMSIFVALFAYALRRWSAGLRERQAFVLSALAGAALILGLVTAANVCGWFAGLVVRPSLPMQWLVYGPHILAMVLIPLAGYRWLALRAPRAALVAYVAWVGVFSWVSVPAERDFIARGIVSYENGYTLREDIVWGAIMYVTALAVYLWLTRRSARAA